MKKVILRKFSSKSYKKEKEQDILVSGREMFINKKPRIEIELRRVSKSK